MPKAIDQGRGVNTNILKPNRSIKKFKVQWFDYSWTWIGINKTISKNIIA